MMQLADKRLSGLLIRVSSRLHSTFFLALRQYWDATSCSRLGQVNE
jgi:hypothetical protein